MFKNKISIIYKLITEPRNGLEEVVDKKPWLLLFVLFLLANAGRIAGFSLILAGPGTAGKFMISFGLSIGVFACFIAWVILTGILHLSAELWNTEGGARDLFIMLGFCMVPMLFIMPLAMIVYSLGIEMNFLFYLITAGIGIWTFALVVAAIRLAYNCPSQKALLIFFTPTVAVLIIPAIIFAAFTASIAAVIF